MTCSHVFCLALSQSSLHFSVKMARDKTASEAKMDWEEPHHLMVSPTGNSWRWPSSKSLATNAARSGSTGRDKCKHECVPARDCLAKDCTMCQSPFGKKNKGLVLAQQAQPGWHQNIFFSPPSRWCFFSLFLVGRRWWFCWESQSALGLPAGSLGNHSRLTWCQCVCRRRPSQTAEMAKCWKHVFTAMRVRGDKFMECALLWKLHDNVKNGSNEKENQ